MAFLEKFTPEQSRLIVGIPYRAGLWVSQADSSGNPVSDDAEQSALMAIIARQASGMFHSAFMHEVMAELWVGRDALNAADERADGFLQDCMEAARLINAHLSRRDLDTYRATIMHIASEVAKAFREDAGTGKFMTSLKLWRGRFGSFMRNEPYDPAALLNISVIEDKALEEIARALSVGADIAVDDTGIPDQPSH